VQKNSDLLLPQPGIMLARRDKTIIYYSALKKPFKQNSIGGKTTPIVGGSFTQYKQY